MSQWVRRISGRLVIVLAFVLSGWAPAWASPVMTHHQAAKAMVMMPGMPMHHMSVHHEMAEKTAPTKHMPCCGEDGCCIAVSCALPMTLPSTASLERLEPAGDIIFKDAVRGGITFPPSLRPPISA